MQEEGEEGKLIYYLDNATPLILEEEEEEKLNHIEDRITLSHNQELLLCRYNRTTSSF
jgi:hypothetical protein